MPHPVRIYDPNPFNPYAAELAAVLASAGMPVERWCRKGDVYSYPGVRQRKVLTGPRRELGGMTATLLRVSGPVAFFLRESVSRSPLIIAWATTSFEYVLLLMLSVLRRRLILVEHNPIAERRLGGLKGRLHERLTARAWRAVSHTDELVAHLPPQTRSRVSHPSYLRWARQYVRRQDVDPVGTRGTALFLGALRADKGVDELGELALALAAQGFDVVVAGRGTPPPSLTALAEADARVQLVGITHNLTDEEVGSQLSRCDVLVAPYRDVTVSGTTVMALSCGLPVVAYRSSFLESLLDSTALVDPGDVNALAVAAHEVHLQPRLNVWRVSPEELDAACLRDWLAILGSWRRRE